MAIESPPRNSPIESAPVVALHAIGQTANFFYVVRYGAMGWVGRFCSSRRIACSSGDQVVIKTVRGHELGEILVGPDGDANEMSIAAATPGRPSDNVLRLATEQDKLQGSIASDHLPADAIELCLTRLANAESGIEIIDVERLFDDATVVFYFLGEEVMETNGTANELGKLWQVNVQFDSIDETIPQPLGGCSSGGCDSCDCSN